VSFGNKIADALTGSASQSSIRSTRIPCECTGFHAAVACGDAAAGLEARVRLTLG
jgi:hypothetical protein